ncbi:MAG: outer membrane beta-barrel protein [Bacteroidota bacterium]
MKKIILASLLLTSASFAQTTKTIENDKGFIGVSAGASQPTGDFGDQDFYSNSSGLAQRGYVADVNFGHRLTEHFGVIVLFRYQENNVDATAIAKSLHKESPDWGWKVKTQGWKIIGSMAGGFATFQLGKSKLRMDVKGAVGLISATSPQIKITGNNGSDNIVLTTFSKSASSFAYSCGIGLRWNFSKVVGLNLNFDYMGSNPEFKNVKTSMTGSDTEYDTYNQSIGSMNSTVGIVFRLK